MNDLLIQIVIMASITFLAVNGGVSYLRKPQSQPVCDEDEELKQQPITVQGELDLAKDNNAIISSKLAAAEVSLSESKAELSGLNAQLEEKNARLSALNDDSTLFKQQVTSLQSKYTQLSSEKD